MAEWEDLHRRLLVEGVERGWASFARCDVEQLSALLTSIIASSSNPPLPSQPLPCPPPPSPRSPLCPPSLPLCSPPLSSPVCFPSPLDDSGTFEAPETFEDDGADDSGDDGSSPMAAAAPTGLSTPPRPPLPSLHPASPPPPSSPSSAASFSPSSALATPPSRAPPPRGLTGRSEQRLKRIPHSTVLPSTPISATLRGLRLHCSGDDSDEEREEEWEAVNEAEDEEPGRRSTPPPSPSSPSIRSEAERSTSSAFPVLPQTERSTGRTGAEIGHFVEPQAPSQTPPPATPPLADDEQPGEQMGGDSDGRPAEGDHEEVEGQEDVGELMEAEFPPSPPLSRATRKRRLLVDDEEEDVEEVSDEPPLRDLTNRWQSTRLLPPAKAPQAVVCGDGLCRAAPVSLLAISPSATVLPLAHHRPVPHFQPATPSSSSFRPTASPSSGAAVTRSGRKVGWGLSRSDAAADGGVGMGRAQEQCGHGRSALERIRQHRLATLSSAGEDDEGEEEMEGEEHSGDDCDDGWLVDDEGEEEEEEGEEVREDEEEAAFSPSEAVPLPSLRWPVPSLSAPSPRGAAAVARVRAAPPVPVALSRRNRDVLARSTFEWLNLTAFASQLPGDVAISWSNKLSSTAGFCALLRPTPLDPSRRRAAISLSVKVVDSGEKLRLTLCHEMCHAAAWLLDGSSRPPHGRIFRRWANKCEAAVPGLEVSTCHRYHIFYPWRYQCDNRQCNRVLGRHSDSLDVAQVHCRCGGRFVKLGKFTRDGRADVRPLNGFAAFVKEQFADVKREAAPHTPHKLLMQTLSMKWKNKGLTERSAALPCPTVTERRAAEEEEDVVQRVLDLSVSSDD